MEHDRQNYEYNIEDDIDNMLIRVLKDDFDGDELSCSSDVNHFMKLDLNEAEMPSFLQNHTQRKDRKALTLKENANTQRIKEIIKRNMEIVKEQNEYIKPEQIQRPNRNNKKFHTVKLQNNVPVGLEVNNSYMNEEMQAFGFGGYNNNMSSSSNLSNSLFANQFYSPSKNNHMRRKYTNNSIEQNYFDPKSFENNFRHQSFTDSLRTEETNFQSLMINTNNTGLSVNTMNTPTMNTPTLRSPNKNMFMFATNNMNISNSQINLQDANDLEQFIESVLRHAEKIDEQSYFKLKGLFLKIVKTQNGSRYLQKSIKKTTKDILSLILDELVYSIQELILDQYANYFCPKFYGLLKLSDRLRYLTQLGPYFNEISRDKVGTYPIQAVIENLTSLEEKKLAFSFFYDNLIPLALDHNGIHVVEKIFICFGDEYNKSIYSVILDNFAILANSTSGLCIIKKIISYNESPEINELVLQKIIENFLLLVQNPFGNYSIQQAIDHWPYYSFMQIIEQFNNRFVNLSMQKYSSNVVEKCLEKGGEIVVNAYIQEVTSTNRIIDLLKNNYGNYVVLKALRMSTGMNRMKLISSITMCMERLGDRKLVLKWKGAIETSLFELNASAIRQAEMNIGYFPVDNMNFFNCQRVEQNCSIPRFNNDTAHSDPKQGWQQYPNLNRSYSKSDQKMRTSFECKKINNKQSIKRSESSGEVVSDYFQQCKREQC